jgi:hypothetical protein
MHRTLLDSLMAFTGLMLLNGDWACVQGPTGPRFIGPVTYSPFSPYLNLLRRSNPFYLNYYGLVRRRPSLSFRSISPTGR